MTKYSCDECPRNICDIDCDQHKVFRVDYKPLYSSLKYIPNFNPKTN